MKTLSKLVTAVSLTGLALTLACCSSEPERKAENAADVGDTVAIEYPASTIMCASRDDSEQVYLSGEIAMRQSRRLDHDSVKSAIDARRNARESAMQTAYSCEWASRAGDGRRYEVVNKEIVGTEDDAFHTVDYCLRPVDSKTGTCWWTANTYGWSSPFQQVAHPQTVAQNAQAR
jgi:hypothetical protein